MSTLFHYRWSLPVLVELYRLDTAKFARLAYRLRVSPRTLHGALHGLLHQRLVTARKVRYGSSLRNEYALTARGVAVARAGGPLLFTIRRFRIEGLALRKWSLSIVSALTTGPMGFNQLARSQETITPRALATALAALRREGVIGRYVTDDCSPRTRYWLQRRAWHVLRRLLPQLSRLERALRE